VGLFALGIALLYAVGFVVVNSFLGRYGVRDVEPIRGRYVAAALLFAVFFLTAAVVAVQTWRQALATWRSDRPWWARGLILVVIDFALPLLGVVLIEESVLSRFGERTLILGVLRDDVRYYVGLFVFNASIVVGYAILHRPGRTDVYSIASYDAWLGAGIVLAVVGLYGSLIYPSVPTWLGGGHPDSIQLVLNDSAAVHLEAVLELASDRSVFLIDEDAIRVTVLIPVEGGKFQAIDIARTSIEAIVHESR
jgi:hypothetical protein